MAQNGDRCTSAPSIACLVGSRTGLIKDVNPPFDVSWGPPWTWENPAACSGYQGFGAGNAQLVCAETVKSSEITAEHDSVATQNEDLLLDDFGQKARSVLRRIVDHVFTTPVLL